MDKIVIIAGSGSYPRLLVEGAKKALARGVTPPIYVSGNVEGGTARNVALEERYFGRVKRL